MREVIEKMLGIERRARRIVAEAEAQAAHLTDEARAEARQVREQARQKALAQVDSILDEAMAAAEKEKASQLAEARRRFESEKVAHQERIAEVAERLVPLLLGSAAASAPTPAARRSGSARGSAEASPAGSSP